MIRYLTGNQCNFWSTIHHHLIVKFVCNAKLFVGYTYMIVSNVTINCNIWYLYMQFANWMNNKAELLIMKRTTLINGLKINIIQYHHLAVKKHFFSFFSIYLRMRFSISRHVIYLECCHDLSGKENTGCLFLCNFYSLIVCLFICLTGCSVQRHTWYLKILSYWLYNTQLYYALTTMTGGKARLLKMRGSKEGRGLTRTQNDSSP